MFYRYEWANFTNLQNQIYVCILDKLNGKRLFKQESACLVASVKRHVLSVLNNGVLPPPGVSGRSCWRYFHLSLAEGHRSSIVGLTVFGLSLLMLARKSPPLLIVGILADALTNKHCVLSIAVCEMDDISIRSYERRVGLSIERSYQS